MENDISQAKEVLGGLSNEGIAKVLEDLVGRRPELLGILQALDNGESEPQIDPKAKGKAKTKAAKGKAKSKSKGVEKVRSGGKVLDDVDNDDSSLNVTQSAPPSDAMTDFNVSMPIDTKMPGRPSAIAEEPSPSETPVPKQPVPPVTEEDAKKSILQFSTFMYFCKEGMDTEMSIDVIRMGCIEHESSCMFKTKDATALQGKHYEKTEETLVFKKGETLKTICIKLIDDDDWNTTLEFELELSEEKGAILGKYLWTARVKKIDDDRFPTNKYRETIDKVAHDPMALSAIPDFSLVLEYFKMNITNPLIKRRTRHMLVVDQFQNFHFVWRILIMKAIVDALFSENPEDCGERFFFNIFPCSTDPNTRKGTLVAFALFLVIPFALVHYIAFSRVFWKVGGTSRKILQSNLLRRFLNYDDLSLNIVNDSDIIVAMTRDAFDVAMKGYMKTFEVAIHAGKIFCLLSIQLYWGAFYAALPVILSPVVLFSFLAVRGKKAVSYAHAMDRALNEMIRMVDAIIDNYRVIIDYNRRPVAVAGFEKKIVAFNGKMILSDAVTANNLIASGWLSNLTTGMWIIVGGTMVINGGSTVGTFVANIEIFKDVGEAWKEIYKICVEMQTSVPNLHRIVKYMNLPTDVEKRLVLNRKRRQHGKEATQQALASNSGNNKSLYTEDLLPIRLTDVRFNYDCHLWELGAIGRTTAAENESEGKCLFTFEFQQGKFVAFVGHPSDGKSTLLKLLGNVLLPDAGDMMIPPHLRVLHVDTHPMFFNTSLLANLTYGNNQSDPDANAQRVKKICDRLRVPESVSHFLENDEKSKQDIEWNSSLSTTQRQQLNIARALVANPEILVLHKPSMYFTDDLTTSTFEVLRDFVDSRGVEMDPAMYHHRRPRTLCMSSSRMAGLRVADVVFAVSKRGVNKIDLDNIQLGMLS